MQCLEGKKASDTWTRAPPRAFANQRRHHTVRISYRAEMNVFVSRPCSTFVWRVHTHEEPSTFFFFLPASFFESPLPYVIHHNGGLSIQKLRVLRVSNCLILPRSNHEHDTIDRVVSRTVLQLAQPRIQPRIAARAIGVADSPFASSDPTPWRGGRRTTW